MRLVIDLQACQGLSRHRGIGRFSMDLAKAVNELATADDIWLALNANLSEQADFIETQFPDLANRGRIVRFRLPDGLAELDRMNVWRTRAAEILREGFLQALQPDLILLSSLFEGWHDDISTSIGALDGGPPTVVIHFDLIPLLNQHNYLSDPQHKKYYFEKLASLRRANLLLAISDYSREEAISSLGVPPSAAVNISGAADSCFRPLTLTLQQEQEMLVRYGITRQMVMYAPGGFDARKNLPRLIEGYASLPAELRANHQLVITSGVHESVRQKLMAAAHLAGLADDELVVTGYVPDNELVKFYSLCKLFVFPSLHEGFGLPVLEAMSCGAPAIGANATSLVEVIGWREALFDPTSALAIGHAIFRALTDEAHRQELRQHALAQAARFSWLGSGKRALDACRALSTIRRDATQHSSVVPAPDVYPQLIEALAAISAPIKPTPKDLVLVARAIAENEATVKRAMAIFDPQPDTSSSRTTVH